MCGHAWGSGQRVIATPGGGDSGGPFVHHDCERRHVVGVKHFGMVWLGLVMS
jgi:hypothetical protein